MRIYKMKIKFIYRLFASHFTVLIITILLIFISLNVLLPKLFYEMKVQELLRTGNYLIQEKQWPKQNSHTHYSALEKSGHLRVSLIYRQSMYNNVMNRISPMFAIQENEWGYLNEGKTLSFQQEFHRFEIPLTLVIMPVERDVALILATPTTETEEVISNVRVIMGWVLFITLGIVILLSFGLSRSLQRRILVMRGMANKIAQGDYEQRLTISGNDEIADLAMDLNHMLERLEQAEKDVKQMEQLRSQFLADISHELKTPLTTIRGLIEALRSNLVKEEEKNRIHFLIETETLRLIRLVQSVMDLERIRSGQVKLHYQKQFLKPVLSMIIEQMKILADEKKIKLNLEVDEQIVLEADEDRIRQIVINLVKNAIQFTEQGEVTIKATQDDTFVYIYVSDTGTGLSEEQQRDIFERFYKVDSSRTVSDGEMGLGLTLVKQLVQAHNGHITVISEVDKGSLFTVQLPKKRE